MPVQQVAMLSKPHHRYLFAAAAAAATTTTTTGATGTQRAYPPEGLFGVLDHELRLGLQNHSHPLFLPSSSIFREDEPVAQNKQTHHQQYLL
ncbi:hypothetical protein B7463_g12079, partial [Scytalidium lignicola]